MIQQRDVQGPRHVRGGVDGQSAGGDDAEMIRDARFMSAGNGLKAAEAFA